MPRVAIVRRTKRFTKKKQQKQRPRRRVRPRANNGLKSVIATGVKSVLGVLPGSTFTAPLADFLFKSIGWTTSIYLTSPIADVSIYGLGGCFDIQPRTLGSGLPGYAELDNAPITSGLRLTTNLTDFRISHLRARLVTCGPASSSGFVYFGYEPFVRGDEPLSVPTITPAYVMNMAQSTKCKIGSSCSLRYYARFTDGLAYQFTGAETSVGRFVICYEDLSRTEFTEFTANDFQCQIELKGNVVARSVDPFSLQYVYTHVVDVLAKVGAFLFLPDSKPVTSGTHFSVKKLAADGFKCEKAENRCKWTYTSFTGVPPISPVESSFDRFGFD